MKTGQATGPAPFFSLTGARGGCSGQSAGVRCWLPGQFSRRKDWLSTLLLVSWLSRFTSRNQAFLARQSSRRKDWLSKLLLVSWLSRLTSRNQAFLARQSSRRKDWLSKLLLVS